MGVFNAVMSLSGMIDTDVIEQEKAGSPHELPHWRQGRSLHHLPQLPLPAPHHRGCSPASACRGSLSARAPICLSPTRAIAARSSRSAVSSRFVLGEDGRTITVGAGAILARLVNEALSKELSGLEFAVGIPGTVGGAISMNAGSRTEWIGSLVCDVVTYKPGEGIRHYGRDDVTWGIARAGCRATRSSSRSRLSSRRASRTRSARAWSARSPGGAAPSPWVCPRADRCSATRPTARWGP